MKTRFFLPLVICFVMICLNLTYTKPAEPQVKGAFKKCTSTEYRYKSGKIDPKSKKIRYVQILDDEGNQVELISYDDNKEEHKNKIGNKYNADGLLSETVFFDESGKPIVKFTYNYDERKNLINDAQYDRDNKLSQIGSYKYDDNNFLIEETHIFYMDGDSVKGVTYYKNDKYGNVIEESANHSSEISVEVSSEVNLSDNTVESEVKQEQSTANLDKTTYQYEYDKKGQIIKKVRNGIGGTKLIYGFAYDEFGNIIEQIDYFEDGKPAVKTVSEYTR